jgi:pantothenate kinase
LARLTTGVVNERFGSEIAVAVSMDGYHFTRAQLDKMPNPVEAHARRGAEFTFDGEGFLALVRRLREPLEPTAATVYAPSFDHAVKDPKEDDILSKTGAESHARYKWC